MTRKAKGCDDNVGAVRRQGIARGAVGEETKMTRIHIVTTTETMVVDEENRIGRPSIGLPPSANWLLLGAVEYRCVFGRYVRVRTFSPDDIRARRVPWKSKNGKQRCFVRDSDHGAVREWRWPRLLDVQVTP